MAPVNLADGAPDGCGLDRVEHGLRLEAVVQEGVAAQPQGNRRGRRRRRDRDRPGPGHMPQHRGDPLRVGIERRQIGPKDMDDNRCGRRRDHLMDALGHKGVGPEPDPGNAADRGEDRPLGGGAAAGALRRQGDVDLRPVGRAAFAYLAAQPNVNKKKIGDIGWCMGGGYAIDLAEHEPRLAACVVNYGALPADADTIQKIHAPVLVSTGALDRGITPAMVHNFEAAMRQAGKQVDAKIYPGAAHAFENPNNKEGYRPAAARDAWQRAITFLAQTLGGQP